ncbi:MAG TPA: prolipoprotein diacylglyceryl transferase family protein [Xanthomonadaceae bacterium]|nr:prolipoprotein diacylglyceryl transferase family protein [Xanthomonadaceae bacterium]
MTPIALHTVFEVLAYAVGFRLFLRERRRLAPPGLTSTDSSVAIGVGAIVGAALGAKLAFWIDDPLTAFANFPDWRHLLEGKSIVGALLGGLIGVEIAKRMSAVHASTGDAFVRPLAVGMMIGRVGCFLAGLPDHTYGNPTALPWGVDFGDAIPRHPTQLYEIAFLALWLWLLETRGRALTESGDRFRLLMMGYLLFRLLVDAIKPVPYGYAFGLCGIQLLCIAGLAYYLPQLPRIGRAMIAREPATRS